MDLEFVRGYPEEWVLEIEQYLRRERREFSEVIVDIVRNTITGTDFQLEVWREIMRIPYGEVRSYQLIAAAIGRPGAVRAVGTACGKNRYPIIIPCHRVVGSSGMGGYAFGLEVKWRLLELEGSLGLIS